MLIALAWKNIWRNKKRSFIVIIALTFGLLGGLFSGAVMMGMGESLVNLAIDRDLSHIQIHKPLYERDRDINAYIPGGYKMLEDIRKMEHFKALSGRTLIDGMGASPASTYGIRIVGINPNDAKNTTSISGQIIEGSYEGLNKRNSIVIGEKLAKRLNLKLRSKIILSFEGIKESIVYNSCRIVGIYKTESSQFDEMNVFVNQKDLFRILETEPIIHEIAIRLDSEKDIPDFLSALKEKYGDLTIQSWDEIAPEIAFLSSTMENFTYLFVAIILFSLIFGIINTMLMSIIDRVREFGVLIAVGMKRAKIFTMVILETIFLSVTGGVSGIIIASISISYFSHRGIDLSIISKSLGSFGVSTMLYPHLPLSMYIILSIMIVIAANIAAIYPAVKAIRIQPAEAVRSY
jgi:ABC-type lipoprotein release transport system permease subunit